MYEEIKIEKNIPFKGTASYSKYPFKEMEVGDSFFVECDNTVIARTIYVYRKDGNEAKKFSTKKEKTGRRVWRIE